MGFNAEMRLQHVCKRPGERMLESLRNEVFGTLVWGSPDAQKGRGSAGVAIALSPVAVNAWESGGCKVFQAGNGRVVGVRLLMKDGVDREVPLFLISAYAPVGTDPQEK